MSHAVETMFSGSGITAWHKLGKVIAGAANAAEAVELAGAGWSVRREPLQLVNSEWRRGEVPAFALVRDDNANVLTVVSPTYEVFQYREAFEILDDVRQGGGLFETGGVLDEGRRAWALMRAEAANEDEIAPGDRVRHYLLASTGHGGDALKFADVTVRVVCQNTLRAALSGARGGVISIRHTRNMRDRAKVAAGILEAARKGRREFVTVAQKMAATRISDADARALAFSALEIDSGAKDGRAGAKRREVELRIVRRDLPAERGTVWGAVNAVTEFVTHSERAGRSRGIDRLISAADGTGDAANQRAWSSALQLVGV